MFDHSKTAEKTSYTKGFTLVELAIVLVIIGLLVGGILTGASLIENAELNKQQRQIENYQIAVRNFNDRFRAIPGDFDKAVSFFGTINPLIANGNGNSRMSDSSNNQTDFDGEIAQFWLHLSSAELIEGKFDGSANLGQGWPETALGGSGIVAIYDSINLKGNIFYLGVGSVVDPASDLQMVPNDALTPLQAASIDEKFDDGHPLAGKVLAQGDNGSGLMNFGPVNFDNASLVPDLEEFDLGWGSVVLHWLIPSAHAAGTTTTDMEDACIFLDADGSASSANNDLAKTNATYAKMVDNRTCQLAIGFGKTNN